MIPLQILSMIEQKLSSYLPGVPIQNHFNLTIGTSSGGLIALGTVMRGLSIADCMTMLKSLSAEVFRPRLSASGWARGRFSRLAMVYLFGSIYPSTYIDRFLHTLFGDKTLMDYCEAVSRGAKVAVTASGVPRGGYLMTNYNGTGSRRHRQGWKHVRAAGPDSRVKVRDAARSTAAAPGIFLPYTIPGVGPVQDGGLWQNNPQRIGEAEARSSWPGNGLADVILSLGTGYYDSGPASPSEAGSPLSPAVQKRPRRLFGGIMTMLSYARSVLGVVDSFMDGEMTHNMCKQEDDRPETSRRLFRCNVKFGSQPPALDDVTALGRLQELTKAAYQDDPKVKKISVAMLSTLFYFELTTRPMRNRNGISCVGRIICDLEPGSDLDRFISSLVDEKAEFFVHGLAVPVQTQRIDYRTFRFEQCVSISVQHLDSPFPVSLRVSGLGRDQTPGPISASPFTLRRLVDAQGWNNHFGRDDFGPTSPVQAQRRGSQPDASHQRKKVKR
ncbi:FabD/lysophospholipase-like protein [Colletotrichum zoysiae]|uniref:FabD/lysophospholipase-like protein n=1 Tax=Colletotrichum zoysiae TaxID=1216348 RepID=A0AAD9LVY2_9PEZI|nr:FabD/lysophospholipase-like protein [Colletotrichum zoysiae]